MSAPKLVQMLAVSDVARGIDRALRDLGGGWVEGEVRDFTIAGSGHAYFTIADENASLSVRIWSDRLAHCQPMPKDGELVKAHFQRVDFYAPYGKTSLLVDYMKPTGDGELLRRREETLRKLKGEGLCDPDRRKPLPAFPRRIGVIAGTGSAAQLDVVRHLQQRLPTQDIVFCPATVQGVAAVSSMIDAIARLQDFDGLDTIIVARGGGSVADLVAFDDERLCRAIFACEVPVITSIGHTKDRPNCDHVAAAYAPVPAKAAELAIRYSGSELLESLDRGSEVLDTAPRRLRGLTDEIDELWAAVRPLQRTRAVAEEVEAEGDQLASLTRSALTTSQLNLASFLGRLNEAAARRPTPNSLDAMGAGLDAAASRITEKRRDYGRAFDRLSGDVRREAQRRLAARRAEIADLGEELRPAVARGLARQVERVAALGSLIDAKDFRRSGWVMATDEDGQGVASAADLRIGDHLRLSFVDGEAEAAITNLNKQGDADEQHD